MDFILFFSLLIPITASPGPVNIALAGFGAQHGALRTMPFFFGLAASASAIILICVIGMHKFILENELLVDIIQYAGIAYIFYLSGKFFKAQVKQGDRQNHDARFSDGFILTILNPKFYTMVVVVFGQFATDRGDLFIIAALFLMTLLVSQMAWLVFGVTIKRIISRSRYYEYIVSIVFGMMLFLTAIILLWNELLVKI